MDISTLTEISLTYLATNWITLTVGVGGAIITGYVTYRINTGTRRDKSRADVKNELIERMDALIVAKAPFTHPLNSPSLDERRALHIAYEQIIEYPHASAFDKKWADDYLGEHLKVLE